MRRAWRRVNLPFAARWPTNASPRGVGVRERHRTPWLFQIAIGMAVYVLLMIFLI
jgi:hypothetical protein